MRGFLGSSSTSTAPVESLTNSTLSHVLPPSVLRNTPRSGSGPYVVPNAATYTRLGSAGSMAMREMRPVFSRPARVHVLPASVDLNMPHPTDTWLRRYGSPVPTYTTFGSDGATAIDPMDCTGWLSKIAFQCAPPSVVFQRPPLAAPV